LVVRSFGITSPPWPQGAGATHGDEVRAEQVQANPFGPVTAHAGPVGA